ncbi:hypothetical protein D6850_14340 [Roseovarius spongiae]|uniref:Calcium-binding protein n=1 Tax=Roseovarius spongiae TaxID=2320272 RepID=A0A3A8ARK6_9RHOB|nr:calcium-binding protein [Roseovarius spongiae]RKF13475.1 hypothetical protein D6850_14340 [Roseovarius spongiae]
MGSIVLNAAGAPGVADPEALIGITDIAVVNGPWGPMLLSTTRGDGWVTAFDINAGVAVELDSWRIASNRLQLESTDLAVIGSGADTRLLLAGLAGSGLTGLSLDPLGLGDPTTYSASGFDMGNLRALATKGEIGFAALRTGGFSVIDFSGAAPQAHAVAGGDPVNAERASAVAMIDVAGMTYGVAAFGRHDALSTFRIDAGGAIPLATLTTETVGGALAGPQALRAATVEGRPYVIAAATDTGSLSVFAIDGTGALTLVDQVMDSRDTRFADAAHLEVLTLDGRTYVAAAGSDSGISLFTLLPGGRLHHLDTIAATNDAPLRGITDITLAAVGGNLHIWAATQAAPYLVQFTATGFDIGQTRQFGDQGGTMSGGADDDVLVGGAGDDAINGYGGRDVLVDGAGSDTLWGGAGADTFVFVIDSDDDWVLDFTPGEDRLDLSALPGIWDVSDLQVETRSWGAELHYRGETMFIQSADGGSLSRADFVDGGLTWIDRVTLPEAAGTITGALSAETFIGTDLGESYDGQAGDDILRGEGGDDTLYGNGGDDTLSGGFGEDLLYGGDGMDLITGDAGFDTIHGGRGGDFLNGGGQADLIYGGEGNDRILGEDGYDQLHGGPGDDTIIGGDDPDRLFGGDGNDSLSGGTNVGYSVDGLFGEGGDDTLMGDGGFDYLDGGEGDDYLDGGLQADNLFGRAGDDYLVGGGGLDRLFGGPGDDMLDGGEGDDGLFGDAGNDSLWGGAGNDRFFGGTGDDVLSGDEGDDTLNGGAGFDTIYGGAGDDVMRGDFNADIFVFEDGHGHDRIEDFEATNDYERIMLWGVSDIDNFTDLWANHIHQSGADVVITSASGTITLVEVDLNDLDSWDFIF